MLKKIAALMSCFSSLIALSLQESEMQALKSNIAIRLTEQDVRQHDLQRLQSILSWLPEVTFGSMYAKLQKSQKISHLQRQNHLFSNQFALTQPIFSPDLLGDLNLSKIAQQGAMAGQEMAINDTLFQVRMLYLEVLIKQKTVDVEKQVIAYLNTAFADEQKKYQTGSGTTLQISQAKSALSQEITKYYNALKESSDAKQQFILTLHLDPDAAKNLQLDDTIGIKDYPLLQEKLALLKKAVGTDIAQPASLENSFSLFSPDEIQNWVVMARQNRPELKRSQIYVQAAHAKSQQSKTQYLPKISAFVDYGYYEPINGQFFRQRNDFAGGVQLSWSLFDSFKREAKVLEISALRKAAGIAYQYESDKVEMTIRNDIHQIEEALFAYLTAADSTDLAQQALEETRVRLSSGSAAQHELQNACQLFAQAQLYRQQAEFNFLKSYFQLRHDAGLDAHF